VGHDEDDEDIARRRCVLYAFGDHGEELVGQLRHHEPDGRGGAALVVARGPVRRVLEHPDGIEHSVAPLGPTGPVPLMT
jgi:hypothetical protein